MKSNQYKIMGLLNIGTSLSSQLKNTEVDTKQPNKELSNESSRGKRNIHKVLAENNKKTILYFIDGVDFGVNSIIEIKKEIIEEEDRIIKQNEYFLIKRTEYCIDYDVIKELLEQNKKKNGNKKTIDTENCEEFIEEPEYL
ncbi:hypothetical protein CWI38_1715p0030 [Hamiltosporidium tvaerminnensis]|uniref:Uncharacterized protein n=2 Tax=Hamiltosporidium TaxID=1176354 RepID=A0A4Q9LKD3_9MICR|nr:hypothetical protein CWI39_1433p0030 [Hamiltosporidium magnivora]TBU01839.1 hypothetical protein CWI37_0616p0020 [Hamiltosporidium tvaerminnensis]TBU08729.1 hypothetical protein CWI36_0103p0050 [Hamiltosporidium magnivora]TBU10502.1 hypothetical protein CWI38_1715p0030 [Hamiltosporidium tvaerminnensis]